MTPPVAPLPANVHLAGECAHEDVPSRLLDFTAGLIPFKANALTEAIDPIKYYEYRAAGLPVLSTAFGDMRWREADPAVHLIRRGMDFHGLRNRLNAHEAISPEELARFRLENAWPSRFKQSRFFNARAAAIVGHGKTPENHHSFR